MNLSIEKINTIIKNQVCYNTINRLKDENLMKKYCKSENLRKNVKSISSFMKEEKIEKSKRIRIIKKILPYIIPSGLKGVTRGLEFNKIVKNKIESMHINKNTFQVCFEKKINDISTHEIPDWYIKNIKTNNYLIGYNQLDLWSGGSQLNRATKYMNMKNEKNINYIFVVCNYIQLKSKNNKLYNIFNQGLILNKLCYINGLEEIVKLFLKNEL